MKNNFYECITEIFEDMGTGLIRPEARGNEQTHRWERLVQEVRAEGGQSVL